MPRRGEHLRQDGRRVALQKYSFPVSLLFENLEDGTTIDEIMEQYDIKREEISAALAFAAQSAAAPALEVLRMR